MSTNEITELEINDLQLFSKDVLPNEELKAQRLKKLQRAMLLWNGIHEKSKIIFMDKMGVKSVDTSIWFVSEKYVCLHAGITILVSCILDIV